jgi:hypothetical protein
MSKKLQVLECFANHQQRGIADFELVDYLKNIHSSTLRGCRAKLFKDGLLFRAGATTTPNHRNATVYWLTQKGKDEYKKLNYGV